MTYQTTSKLYAILAMLILGTSYIYSQNFYLGGDLSYVNELEDCGIKYYDAGGTAADPYELLADKGMNMVRLRLWHNPQWTEYSNLNDVIRSMHRASAMGLSVMLDLHYSDFWADPSRQWRPEAWNSIENDITLGDSLYNYTIWILRKLQSEDLYPSIVQIGNEINGNILIKRTSQDIDASSPGLYPVDWSRQSNILQKGLQAIQDFNTEASTNIRSLLHVAQPDNATYWFSSAWTAGLKDFDVIGLSYYPQWSEFEPREVGDFVNYLVEEYGKEVMIVETGYPWTVNTNDWASNVLGNDSKMDIYSEELSIEVQRDFMTELTYLVKTNGGSGVIYWEPAWVSSDCETYWAQGSHYENATLFNFSNELHSGADYLEYDYSLIPEALKQRNVLFRVNMKNIDTQNGVYVTGDFSGNDWQFLEMTRESDNWFKFETIIPGRSVGAFIFYRNNIWNNSYRENVPAECAEYWGSHRKYQIISSDETYSFAWESCTDTPVSIENQTANTTINYSANLGQFQFTESNLGGRIKILNIAGQVLLDMIIHHQMIDVSYLSPGIYILQLEKDHNIKTLKFQTQ